jgi:hypothetical protein
MPVNYDSPEVDRAFQKLIADPQGVVDALTFQRDARPHARVAEEMFSSDDRGFK